MTKKYVITNVDTDGTITARPIDNMPLYETVNPFTKDVTTLSAGRGYVIDVYLAGIAEVLSSTTSDDHPTQSASHEHD